MRFVFFALGLFLTSTTNAENGAQLFPADFSATFTLYKSGLPVAETKYKLSTKQSTSIFQSSTNLKGLMSLFSDVSIDETSTLQRFSDKKIRLVRYQFQQSGKNQQRIDSAVNWNKHTVSTIIDQQAASSLSFAQNIWDKNSVLLALMMNADNDIDSLSFNTVSQSAIKVFTFTNIGQKEIEVEDDNWVPVSAWQRTSNNKQTIFYLDPAANNLPLKIEQYTKQQLRATLWLDELNWND